MGGSKEADDANRLFGKTLRFLDSLPRPDPAVKATLQQLPTRVYL